MEMLYQMQLEESAWANVFKFISYFPDELSQNGHVLFLLLGESLDFRKTSALSPDC